MTIKTATKITAIGLGIGVTIGIGYPLITAIVDGQPPWGIDDSCWYSGLGRLLSTVKGIFTNGSLLFFFIFLSREQHKTP